MPYPLRCYVQMQIRRQIWFILRYRFTPAPNSHHQLLCRACDQSENGKRNMFATTRSNPIEYCFFVVVVSQKNLSFQSRSFSTWPLGVTPEPSCALPGHLTPTQVAGASAGTFHTLHYTTCIVIGFQQAGAVTQLKLHGRSSSIFEITNAFFFCRDCHCLQSRERPPFITKCKCH